MSPSPHTELPKTSDDSRPRVAPESGHSCPDITSTPSGTPERRVAKRSATSLPRDQAYVAIAATQYCFLLNAKDAVWTPAAATNLYSKANSRLVVPFISWRSAVSV